MVRVTCWAISEERLPENKDTFISSTCVSSAPPCFFFFVIPLDIGVLEIAWEVSVIRPIVSERSI